MLIDIYRVVPEAHIRSGGLRTIVDLIASRELEEERGVPILPTEVVGPTAVVGRFRIAPDMGFPIVDVQLLAC